MNFKWFRYQKEGIERKEKSAELRSTSTRRQWQQEKNTKAAGVSGGR